MLNVYRHKEWHDFFVMVGGAAAALAGLVFVAMSLNLATIFQDPTHRSRAIGTLAGFTSVFAICATLWASNRVSSGGGLVAVSRDLRSSAVQ
jgi:hypothetical protein